MVIPNDKNRRVKKLNKKIKMLKELELNINYNINFTIKCVGYFKNYIYTYNDYLINKNILNIELINHQIGILYVAYKNNNDEESLTGIIYFDFFNNYNDFINFVDNQIALKKNKLNVKEIKNLLIVIKMWNYRDIFNTRQILSAQKEFDKKLLKFQKVVDKLVDYKINASNNVLEYSRFLAERILTKELKPVLHIKVKDLESQEECLKHLLNLLSKKWIGVKKDIFKFYFHKAIKEYQDNYEHNDAW